MWYAIIGTDRKNSLEARKAARPAHVARLEALRDAGRLKLAGPFPAIDAEDPGRVLGRTSRPIMVPEAEYEKDGFLHDVVFPSGHIDLGGGDIRIYYGAADTTLCAADLAIDDVIATLTPV